MRILKYIALGIFCLVLLDACRTIRELRALSRCEFRIQDISRLNMANVNLLSIKELSDLNLADAAKVGLGFKNGSLPTNITFDIEIRNPNENLAAMEKLDWILELDEKSVVDNTTEKRVEVEPNGGTSTLPISTSIDIKKLLAGESLKSIVNLVSAVGGNNVEESRIRLKVKPRFRIAGILLSYPGFIKLTKTFNGKAEGEE